MRTWNMAGCGEIQKHYRVLSNRNHAMILDSLASFAAACDTCHFQNVLARTSSFSKEAHALACR